MQPLDTEQLDAWIDQMANYMTLRGASPIAGRIVGWLMVCTPSEQTAASIAAATQSSRASITTNMALLSTMGMVERRHRPGERTAYYRIADDAWANVVRHQIASLTIFTTLAESGLELVGADDQRAARLRRMQQVIGWMNDVFASAPPIPPPAEE